MPAVAGTLYCVLGNMVASARRRSRRSRQVFLGREHNLVDVNTVLPAKKLVSRAALSTSEFKYGLYGLPMTFA
jgi:hypothetical protein